MSKISWKLFAILLVASAAQRAFAEVPVFLAPNATSPAPGQERYIVALASGARANQLALGGGAIEREAGLYAQLMVPAEALDGLRHNPKVRYIQRVLPPSEAADLLRNQSAPEGAVSAASTVPSLVTAPMSTTVWDSGSYTYDGMGNITAMGGSSYTYDKVARLVQSTTQSNGVGWAETYAYDAFGNMTSKTTNGATLTIPVNVYTNRMNGASYDIAGNVTWDGLHTFQYDPFGQPREISESGGLILYPIYDADGERIGLVTEGSNEWKWTPRDLSGKVAREYVGLGGSVGQPQNFFYVWKEDYVYRGGLLAGAVRETAEGGLRHFHLDHLGTPRVTTNASGQVMSKNDYYPFGQEITSMRQQIAAGYDRDDPMKFTGHERDFIGGTYTENTDNLDYMHAREYNAGLGRFTSVDSKSDTEQALRRPQIWNLYSYVTNNPIGRTDPTGHSEVDVVYKLVQYIYDGKKVLGFKTLGTLTKNQAIAARQLGKSIQVTAKTEKQAYRVASEIEDAAFPTSPTIHHGRDAHMSGNQAHVQSDGEDGHSYYRTFASQPIRNTAMAIGGLLIPMRLDLALTLTEYGLGQAAVYGNQKIDELRQTSPIGGEARGEAAADEIIGNH